MKNNIALIGFMGSGKSSVGKELAKLLPDMELIDLDTYIEAMSGKSIPEIFEEQGEAAFRAMEKDALDNIFITNDLLGTHSILALGGGTVTSEACRRMLRRNTECFYLKGSIETLAANLGECPGDRPLLRNGRDLESRVKELMAERGPLYESTAHHTIIIDGKTPLDCAVDIITEI